MLKTIVGIFLLFVLVMFPDVSRASELPWQLRINEDGITVNTRRVEASPILEYQGSVTVDAPLARVVSFYEDEKLMPSWYYQCVRSELVERENAESQIFYFVVHLPWPVSERDSVFRRIKSVDQTTGEVTYSLSALPEKLPIQKGKIRVLYLRSSWRFTPLKDGRTEIHFQQHSNPGGSLPAMLVNKLVVDIPYNTLRNLRKKIMETAK